MNTVTIVLLVILVILIAALIGLYFFEPNAVWTAKPVVR